VKILHEILILICFYTKLGWKMPLSFSWLEKLYSHMGAEKHPTVGSSGEYWSMNKSLN